jgi:bacteriocin biosynthesis cyclodehydratase domain-containing protein
MAQILVLADGAFGRAVARALSGRLAVREDALRAALPRLVELVSGADFVAIAAWRRCPDACALVDEACGEAGVPWTSAVIDGAELVSGPLVIPRHGPCWTCYRRRLAAHTPTIERARHLDRAYAADPSLGPGGFLPGMVEAAAGGILRDRLDGRSAAGRVRILDLLSGQILETRAIRVHGCDRCGSARGARRYVEALIPVADEVLR